MPDTSAFDGQPRLTPLSPFIKPLIGNWDAVEVGKTERPYDRKMRMLRQVNLACRACSMCELGLAEATEDNRLYDPHVFSNMNPVRFVVVGQGPGMEEIKQGTPFVGQSGRNFDAELAAGGLTRADLYISNAVRCHTANNTKPTPRHIARCKPFLAIEVGIIKPHFLISLGSVAFSVLCPDTKYADALGKLTHSQEFDVKVFAIYHPSPLNLADKHRAADFKQQMALLCKLIKAVKKQHGE